ncbi:amidohydrolase family protein [Steroidobacter sp.]|uniref:amidohydrolase family protein n=1 Tax=Steroidobacter sp. TaxID=1978227 RepID=UPI001A60D99D|nr:amidohydrolase family protein [Steroidobacter sp.]MBL8264739.1 amidohydrolase family protein [Steroidobacter sp.]
MTLSSGASAQDVLIRGATVHTLEHSQPKTRTDVLVRNGKVAAIGSDLAAPNAIPIVEANGRPVTPGIFGSLGGLGVDELGQYDSSLRADNSQGVRLHPEFDASIAFNPRSINIPVARIEGVTWTVLAPGASDSFMAGQGAAVTLDGATRSVWPSSTTLFLEMSAASASKFGGSRAAVLMSLQKAFAEARSSGTPGPDSLLSVDGKKVLARYLKGGRVVVRVDRAVEISRLIEVSRQIGFKLVIVSGTEAWMVADELAAARVPVVLDPLENLPDGADSLQPRLDNAVLLQKAGVLIAFMVGKPQTEARKLRQSAGNAVAQGLEWNAALAAITINPAKIFGVDDQRGSIAVGKSADLVIWNADPLDLHSAPDQVWIDGRAMPMESRQTQLRDRYLRSTQRTQHSAEGNR